MKVRLILDAFGNDVPGELLNYLLEKKVDPNHKRILRIGLTAKGEEILALCNATMDIFETRLLEGFNKEDISFYHSFIGKVLEKTKQLNG